MADRPFSHRLETLCVRRCVGHGQTMYSRMKHSAMHSSIFGAILDSVQVTKVTARQASCMIVVVNERTLPESFPAVIRCVDVHMF
eukprot:SAG31_NODE_25_length_33055_cov_11.407919_15_plen_85_part_00